MHFWKIVKSVLLLKHENLHHQPTSVIHNRAHATEPKMRALQPPSEAVKVQAEVSPWFWTVQPPCTSGTSWHVMSTTNMWPRDHTVQTAYHASCPSTPYTLPAPRSHPHQPAVWSWRCFSDCHYGTSIVISLGLNWNGGRTFKFKNCNISVAKMLNRRVWQSCWVRASTFPKARLKTSTRLILRD